MLNNDKAWPLAMGLLIGSACLLAARPSVAAKADADPGSVYDISLSGPQVNLQASCGEPCAIDRVEVVGDVGMKASKTDEEASQGEDEVSFGSECFGECKKQKTQLRVTGPRTLREGVEVTIEDRWAHFIIYTVTDTAKGPATRRRHYEFRVDRPLIEVSLGDHQLTLRAEVEQDPGVIRRRTIE